MGGGGERRRLADAHCPAGAFTLHLKIDSWPKSRFRFPPRVATWIPTLLFLQPGSPREKEREESVLGFPGLQDPKEKGQVDARERVARRRGEKKEEEILVPRYRGGPRPCRLFVIVICITMDETRVMGSWDLPGEHDGGGGRKGPSSPVGTS